MGASQSYFNKHNQPINYAEIYGVYYKTKKQVVIRNQISNQMHSWMISKCLYIFETIKFILNSIS